MDNFLNTVKWLHVELSSRCNAWCPSCPRNVDGYKLIDGLIEEDLSLEKLSTIISTLPNIETIQLCGNFGDPLAAKNITEVLDFLIQKKLFIRIHTNGSFKTTEWWSNLGKKIKNTEHLIFFAIDGLEDTHTIYRQGTDFKKILENAKEFISCGGNAVWQFIPFAHNEHQIKKAYALSKKLKFHHFMLQKKPRVNLNAKHYQTGEALNLSAWSKKEHFHDKMTAHIESGKSCMHLEYPSLYISSSGKISPCCFMYDVEYTDKIDMSLELETNPRPICKSSCNF